MSVPQINPARRKARSVWSARSLLPLSPAAGRKSGSKLAALQTLRALRHGTPANSRDTIRGTPVLVGKAEPPQTLGVPFLSSSFPNKRKSTNRPPVHALLVDLTGWTLDRTASLPKSHRFTFGERVDNLTLDYLELVIEAIYASPPQKVGPLRRVNLNLEKLRVFWRLMCDRRWLSEQQLLFVAQQLEEIGRMVGGWLKQVERWSPGGDAERGHSCPPRGVGRTKADKNVGAPNKDGP